MKPSVQIRTYDAEDVFVALRSHDQDLTIDHHEGNPEAKRL
jgi:hypothetical protein